MLILFLIVVDHAGIAAQIYLGEPRPIIHNDGREPASPHCPDGSGGPGENRTPISALQKRRATTIPQALD